MNPRAVIAPLMWIVALTLAMLLPFAVGSLGTPHGMLFRSTLKAVGDEGIYQAAVNEGLHGQWLFRDPYMLHPPAPILIYALYVAGGHLGALVDLPVGLTYILLHVVCGLALLGALWALARPYLPGRDLPWFLAFAVCTSGLYWLDALLALFGYAPVSLAWLALPPLSAFTAMLMGVHETLALAGLSAVLTGLLGVVRQPALAPAPIAYGALGMAALGLAMPAYLPLALPVGALAGGMLLLEHTRRSRRVPMRLCWSMALILAPGVLLALYYYWVLHLGPWSASDFTVISPPSLPEALITWGALSPMAYWGWRHAAPAARPLATVLAVWYVPAAVFSEVPLTEFFRYTMGLTMLCGGLFALGLSARGVPTRLRLRALDLAGLGAATQLLFLLSVLLAGRAPYLYITVSENAAFHWLAAHAHASDVVLAPMGFSNMAADYATCRFVTGYQTLTFDIRQRDQQLHLFYGRTTPPTLRLAVLRAVDPRYVVYDAADPEDGPADPRSVPELERVFAAPGIAIYAVSGLS
jgi:hypothetical protein